MTIKSLIELIQEEKPNTFSNEKLVAYINDIELEVAEEFGQEIRPYTWEDDQDTELLALPPNDRLYVSFLKAKIDYANEEYESYSNNSAQHIQDFQDFVDWVVKHGKYYEARPVTRFKNIF